MFNKTFGVLKEMRLGQEIDRFTTNKTLIEKNSTFLYMFGTWNKKSYQFSQSCEKELVFSQLRKELLKDKFIYLERQSAD